MPDIFQITTVMIDGASRKVLKLGVQGGNVDSDGRPISLAGSITATLQKKTTQQTGQTLQAAGLIGQWKYDCHLAKGNPHYFQRETLDFTGNKLKTNIAFYSLPEKWCKQDQNAEYHMVIEADIVLGKVINAGAANEHTQIGIKTTKVEIKQDPSGFSTLQSLFNRSNFYAIAITNLYAKYGPPDLDLNIWKDISNIPEPITHLHIGTQLPDVFKISTININNMDRKVLKMGDDKGRFDINGRAMSLEAKGAVRQ
jgi:hypothetical protein